MTTTIESIEQQIEGYKWSGKEGTLYIPLSSLGMFKGYASVEGGMAPEPVTQAWVADTNLAEGEVAVTKETVNLRDVYFGQRLIIKSKLRKFLRQAEEEGIESLSSGSLPRVYRYGGRLYMADGHHRAVLQGMAFGAVISVNIREV